MSEKHPAPGVGTEPGDHRESAPPAGPTPLRRSRSNKVVAGVCGGLGREYDLDPVIFRVVFCVLAIAGGVGLIAYGFTWLLFPLDGEEENEGRRLLSGRVEGPALSAVLCALVGCGLLLSMLNNGTVLTFSLMVSMAVIGSTYWSQRRRAEHYAQVDVATAHAVADAPPETQAPPSPGGPSWWRDPITKDGTSGTTGTGYLWGPDDGPHQKPAPGGRSRRIPGQRPIGGWTFLLALVAAGLGTFVHWPGQPVGTSLQAGLGCALAVFGLSLVISARFGRTGVGTILAALLTSGLLAVAAVLPKGITGDWVRTEWRPATASAVRAQYEIGSGQGLLDLSAVRLGRNGALITAARVGAGRMEVRVPADATVRLTVHVGVGDIRLPDEPRDDVDISPGQHRELTLRPADGREPRGTLVLDLEAGAGQVEVNRAAS